MIVFVINSSEYPTLKKQFVRLLNELNILGYDLVTALRNSAFDRFPKQVKCPICGTNNDGACVLVGIAYTTEGNICEAQPVHLACITEGLIWYKNDGLMAVSFNKQEGSCTGSSGDGSLK